MVHESRWILINMAIETYIVDAFTDEPLKGNPAGVCLLENDDFTEDKMLAIAGELGLSETAFLRPTGHPNKYSIRFFSPKMEIPLCGHATLASAKVLFEKEANVNNLHFVTIQNLDLVVTREGDMINMEFPVYATHPAEAPITLLESLGITSIANSVYNAETNILLLEIKDCQVLQNLNPDFESLYRSHDSINGVLVTARSNKPDFDFESRYFWPWSGTNEDPVTGGTHTFLTSYWSEKLNKTKMRSFQCSQRTGFMELELVGEDRLIIKGDARIVFEGRLNI